jgi:hypothetical protein
MKSAKSSKKPAKKTAVAKRPKKTAAVANRGSAHDDLTIKALGDPPKEGSLGRQHWDKAIGKTVGAYRSQFDQKERRNAAQWLSNWLSGKGGKVELVG